MSEPVFYTPELLGLAPYKPRAGRLKLLEHVRGVLLQYASHLPLTVRQIYYRLVATHTDYPKTTAFYKNVLADCLMRARRGGLIAWDDIRDDGLISEIVGGGYSGLPQFEEQLRWQAETYGRDKRLGQSQQIFVWCEAAGMLPQLETACEGLPVMVLSCGGTDSVTAKYKLAVWCNQRDSVLLHVGDWDPMGLVGFTQFFHDVPAMIRDICRQGGTSVPGYACKRICIREEHVAQHGLLTGKVKKGDQAKLWYPGIDGDRSLTCEVEALPPDLLARLVRQAVEDEVDMTALFGIREIEERERDKAIAALADLRIGDIEE